jgi:TonB family protein
LKDLLAADGASVYVFSLDDALADAVQHAGGEQYPVHVLSDWTQLRSLVDGGPCKIVLLDADAVGDELEQRVAELRALLPSLVILLAAPRDTAQKLIGMLSDRRVHRLLIKPAAIGITRLLLESAVSRYLQLREDSHHTLEEEIENLRRRAPVPAKTKWPAWIVATALVSLLIAAVVVGGFSRFGSLTLSSVAIPQSRDTLAPAVNESLPAEAVVSEPIVEVDASPAQPAPFSAPVDDPFASELARAALALVEGRVAAPDGDNALDIYAAILDQDATQSEAAAQLGVVVDTLFGQAEAALIDGRLDEAAASIAHIGRARPAASGRLEFLQTQLARARAREVQARTTPPPPIAAPTLAPQPASEFDSLLTIAETRLDRGQLLTPAGDSAQAYLERAALLGPDSPRLLALRLRLAGDVAAQARLLLDSGDIQQAATLTESAFRLGADSQLLTALEIDLANALERIGQEQRRERYTFGVARLQQGQLLAPENDSALYHFSSVRREQPDYPGLAAQWEALMQAIAAQVQTAIADNDWRSGETIIAALQAAGADALAQSLSGELVNARRQVQFLSVPAPASELSLLEYDVPEYPPAQLRRNVQGWVELQFVVTDSGMTRDLTVVAAEPPDVFDQAAINSVAAYRYRPFELGGQVYSRLVRLRIRFALE